MLWMLGVSMLAAAAFPGRADAAPRPSCDLPASTHDSGSSPDDARSPAADGPLRPFTPERIVTVGCAWPEEIRAIVIDTDEIRLQAGGQVVRRFARRSSGPTGVDMASLAELIDDPRWLGRDGDGVVTIAAALVQMPGTALAVGGANVREVRLIDRPHVAIIGFGATATFTDVTVTSWSSTAEGPQRSAAGSRPYLLFDHASDVVVDGSSFTWLGSPVAGATGVTLRGRASGAIAASSFVNNYVGLTASDVQSFSVDSSTIRQSVSDGVRIDAGRDARVEATTVQSNGGDGIVVRSTLGMVLRDNHVWGNGNHGVVLADGTLNTVVVDNVVEPNVADGIVLDGASGTRMIGNLIGAHRVGLRLEGDGTTGNIVRDNRILGSETGVSVGAMLTGNVIDGNTITAAPVLARFDTDVSVPASGAVVASEVEQRFGLGIVGMLLAVLGVGVEVARRLTRTTVVDRAAEQFGDLERFDTPPLKPDFAHMSDH